MIETPLYSSLRERVTKDTSWKKLAACGMEKRPANQCARCHRFDSTAVVCRCRSPQWIPLTEENWVSWFYPARGENFSDPKKICKTCPVKAACLEYALGQTDIFGIWGGRTERERRNLRMGRELFVICVYCQGSVKAGQKTRRTCNRQGCRERWADERAGVDRPTVISTCACCGFRITADHAQTTCNRVECRQWESSNTQPVLTPVTYEPVPEHTYVIIGQEVFDLADVVLEGLPRTVRRDRFTHPSAGTQMCWEEAA